MSIYIKEQPGTDIYTTADYGYHQWAHTYATSLYDFEETGGTTATDSISAYNGTYGTGCTLNTAPIMIEGKSAVYFSNSANWHVTSVAAAMQSNTIVTIMFWAKLDGLANNIAFHWSGPASERIAFVHLGYTDGKTYWDTGQATGGTPTYQRLIWDNGAGGPPRTAQWYQQEHFYVFSCNSVSGNKYIYVDGELVASSGGNTQTLVTPTTGQISYQCAGTFDGFAVFPVEFTGSQIKTLYQWGKYGRTFDVTYQDYWVKSDTPNTFHVLEGGAATYGRVAAGYEEGSWTPQLWDASLSNSEGQTYGNQAGYYRKIGRLVIACFRMGTTGVGTLSGDLYVGNLPFIVRGIEGAGYNSWIGGPGITSAVNFTCQTNQYFAPIKTWDLSTGTSGVGTTEWSNSDIVGHLFYRTDY